MPALPYLSLQKGTLLIASGKVNEGIYKRSVLLLCEHSRAGSFAVILNKPLSLAQMEEPFPIEELSHPNLHFRTGGPIGLDQMILLHPHEQGKGNPIPICPGVYLGGELDLLEETSSDPSPIFLLFGFGEWEAGTLEREFLNGEWLLHPASKELIFDTPPENMWQILLRQMGGKYKTLSMLPEHPEWN
ncbi:MAG: YqgE/AlgH family protein [Simkania negevensis]|nr:YqgE/AlgH family protein [Simkania negevensis]